MVIQLLIVWAVAVVSFFALWALLTGVFHRIGGRRHETDDAEATDEDTEER